MFVFLQGYPQRMKLQNQKLNGIYTFCFLIFITRTRNFFIALPNH